LIQHFVTQTSKRTVESKKFSNHNSIRTHLCTQSWVSSLHLPVSQYISIRSIQIWTSCPSQFFSSASSKRLPHQHSVCFPCPPSYPYAQLFIASLIPLPPQYELTLYLPD
jgi:hypothetical protein